MTTQERIRFVLLLARHLLHVQFPAVALHVECNDTKQWRVYLDHQGFTLYADEHDDIDGALDELLGILAERVHQQMEDAAVLLDRVPPPVLD